jgi:hypothetical protein
LIQRKSATRLEIRQNESEQIHQNLARYERFFISQPSHDATTFLSDSAPNSRRAHQAALDEPPVGIKMKKASGKHQNHTQTNVSCFCSVRLTERSKPTRWTMYNTKYLDA